MLIVCSGYRNIKVNFKLILNYNYVASQHGTLTPPDTWFRPPWGGGVACDLIVETSFPRLYTDLMTVPDLTFIEWRGFHG